MQPKTTAGVRPLALLPYADAGLFVLVMAIVGMMIVPLPTWLLDLLLASNLALAMLLLITALRVPSGLAFSTLPSVLLITTLYRLALNVSSTRLILLQGDAGRVIRAFGEFVVRGNYAVGAVVFLIITIIQYLVVAKGSERIAEVGARFTLDALPGKQLAIDADLRAGALSPDSARQRRATLERESQFYGAMDGAMKFVKGDAIAGIAIAVVCFVGGTAIAVFMHGRSWDSSVRSYGLLTIGDALVSQIPSLVISTAAGLTVTRVSRAQEHERVPSLGEDIAAQLFGAPHALWATAAFVLVLSLVPGLPFLPFLLLGAALGLGARKLQRVQLAQRAREPLARPVRPRLLLELGRAPSEPERARLEAALLREAERVARRLELPVPPVGVALHLGLELDAYTLRLRDAPVQRGHSPNTSALVGRIEFELAPLLARHARELLDMQDVQARLDEHALQAPLLTRSVVPKLISLSALTELLRRLLDESVGLRAWDRMLEAVASCADREPHQQLAQLRRALREQIVHERLRQGELVVHRLDPLIEDAVREAIVSRKSERYLALAPELAHDIVDAVRTALATNPGAVLLTQSDVRRFVFEVLAGELPDTTVLSYDELPPSLTVEEREPIRV